VGQAGEREPVVTTDSDQAELGDGDNLLGGLGAQVGQLTALQIGSHALDRVEFWPVRRQELFLQPVAGGDVGVHGLAAVDGEVVQISVTGWPPRKPSSRSSTRVSRSVS
jgi:hypothetical protein